MNSSPIGSVLAAVNVVDQTICSLQDEILGLKLKQKASHEQRRRSLNKILDIKGAIRVFCRIRPFLPKDGIQIHQPISTVSDKIVVTSSGSVKEFGFDKVFTQQATQDDVFVEVEPILKSVLHGSNVCLIAYGQTGSGKTFTMDGTKYQPGIVTQALKELFHQASMDSNHTFFTFSMSMLEVYMGSLRDLLAPKQSHKSYEVLSRCNLNVQTDIKGLVEIENLTEVKIPDPMKANFWYGKGRRVRSTSWTNVNEASSRSHCLTRITVYRHGDAMKQKTVVTKLWMIDLGGSERLLKTGATGQTLEEGRAINLSISALGDVIAALRRKRAHVPYRNSKLTQILKDSLGTGSKVLMLVHVSPCDNDVSETTCSLNFAKRANDIESNRELTMHLKILREKRISELQDEMAATDEECQKIQDQIQNAELLLTESKKLLSDTYGVVYDMSPKSLHGEFGETFKTINMSDKEITQNSSVLPRFMTSTAASRQRRSYVEHMIVGRASSVKFGHKSSMQLSASQFASYSDPGFKAVLRNSNKRAQPLPEDKMVNTSNPNFKGTISRHRRRMSDLI